MILSSHSRMTGPLGDRIRSDRQGATLVEVLMALLIMAIGITSVFTLFPLSILRSIKANQLTNAKLVEENARELIQANPQLVTGAPPWTPGTSYGTQTPYTTLGSNTPSDSWVTPRPRPGRLLPETNLLYDTTASGFSSAFEPKWRNRTVNWTGVQNSTLRGGYRNQLSPYITTGTLYTQFPVPINDGTISWNSYRHSRYEADPTWSAYVVDPLGWYEMNDQGLEPERNRFGQLDRIHCQLTPVQAAELFSSLDTWYSVLDQSVLLGVVSIPSPGAPVPDRVELQFETQLDLTQSRRSGRVVLLSEDGRRTQALVIDTTTGANNSLPANQVSVLGTLPPDFYRLTQSPVAAAPEIGIFQARIDAFERRYSWMMTVHRGPHGEAKIACVVFFNRNYSILDEEAVVAEFHGPGPAFRTDQVMLSWPQGRAGGDLALKEGGYIFDAIQGHWYRMQKVETFDKVSNPRTALITLNTAVTVPTDTLGAEPDYDGQAIVMPNIVTIFNLDME